MARGLDTKEKNFGRGVKLLSKNLSLLKQELFDIQNEGILKYLIPVLEDFEKRITELEEKIKKLEQAQTYFPMEYQTDGYDNRIGGQDDRGNIFNLYEKKGDD